MGVLGNNALVGASAAGSGAAGIYPYQITYLSTHQGLLYLPSHAVHPGVSV